MCTPGGVSGGQEILLKCATVYEAKSGAELTTAKRVCFNNALH